MVRPSRAPAEEDAENTQPPSNTLEFNEPLSWKAGKAIPVTTLVKRLTTLSKQLSLLEQEGVDRDSLAIPAKELAQVGLMLHRDSGVKAFTACCLADMLRLHAPDAPYTAQQLKVRILGLCASLPPRLLFSHADGKFVGHLLLLCVLPQRS
jgi:sister-chromatid-cohesion protein PDS5